MRNKALSLVAATAALVTGTAHSQTPVPAPLQVSVKGITSGQPIPSTFAYCMPDGSGKSKDGGNISPEITWSGAPEGTKSFAIIVVDRDVPASFEMANQEGKTIPENFPRQSFYHWVLVDIPPTVTGLEEGKDSAKVIQGGKPTGKTEYGINGQNDYAKVFKGSYGGYDGPCPPWNDERLHHYHFIVYALDVPTLGLEGPVKGPQVEDSLGAHVLATGEVVGTYTQNPKLLEKQK